MSGTHLRIAAWNCRQGADRKREAFARLGADVLIVPECSRRPRLSGEAGVSFSWRGSYAPKGLGVFGFNGWTLAEVSPAEELPWVHPLFASSPGSPTAILVLAVWTLTPRRGRPSYADQVARTIEVWEPELRNGATVMAGDLNCSLQGPSSVPHLENLRRLEALGVRSAYHHHTGEAYGEEQAMTLRWIGRGSVASAFHCDLVFLSPSLVKGLERAEIGAMGEWVASGLSDHCPVSATLRIR